MIRTASLSVIALTALVSQAVSQPFPLPPPGARLRVMSDTREYCDQLTFEAQSVMVQRPRVPPGVQALAEEGQRLCLMGHLRPGIARLRMAIRRLHDLP